MAYAYCSSVMVPCSRIAASTASRRAIAFPVSTNGLYAEGAWGEAGQECRLAEVEVTSVLREVGLGGRLDAVGEVPVEDLVEVGSENALLRPGVVELDRETGLLQFPLH